MNLSVLRVHSFVTKYDDKEADTIKGASDGLPCSVYPTLCDITCVAMGCAGTGGQFP